MVFLRQNQEDVYCHEQAQVDCESVVPQPESGAISSSLDSPSSMSSVQQQLPEGIRAWLAALQFHGGPQDLACADHVPCMPAVKPELGYIRSMIGGALAVKKGTSPPRISSIGLGAATIPLWFSRAIPSASIDAVDISSDVVAAAPCFGVKPSSSLRLVQQDGREYANSRLDGSYDIVFMDAFDDNDNIPGCLSTVDFFETIRRKLRLGGVLSMNVWDKDLTNLYSSVSEAFEGQVLIGTSPGEGNLVLLASQGAIDASSSGSSSLVEIDQSVRQM